jgi:hypothetical protein
MYLLDHLNKMIELLVHLHLPVMSRKWQEARINELLWSHFLFGLPDVLLD